jgi:hypothetical protein
VLGDHFRRRLRLDKTSDTESRVNQPVYICLQSTRKARYLEFCEAFRVGILAEASAVDKGTLVKIVTDDKLSLSAILVLEPANAGGDKARVKNANQVSEAGMSLPK